MHILIAPNAFKHALDADDVARAIESGLLTSKLSCTCTCFPVGDGGNGTGKLLVDRLQGERLATTVNDPLGRPVSASCGLVHGGRTAVIELAEASGLHLLDSGELDPLRANTYGTGQLIRAALDNGAKEIILCMGGSATVDGGSGLLAALGVRFLDESGVEITDLPSGLERLRTIDRSTVDPRLQQCELTVLCDVDNPLLGENGAAHVFGPQKGATPNMVKQLEVILTRYAAVMERDTGISVSDLRSGGVAGGASAGLRGVLGAKLVGGIDYFLGITGFDDCLKESDLVVTAEGSIDGQTLQGKAPYGVAMRAKEYGLPVIGLAGQIPVEIDAELNDCFDVLMAIGNGPVPLEEALKTTKHNLERTAKQIGNLIAQLT